MKEAFQFFLAHQTTISLIGAWLFSAAAATMPPLPEKSGYFATWVYSMLQAVAANINKVKGPAAPPPLPPPQEKP